MAARKRGTPHKPKQNDPLWRVAVHEAGHAVAAHAVGVPVGDVTIIPGATTNGDGYAGRTSLNHSPHHVRRALDELYDLESDSGDGSRDNETFAFVVKSMQVSFAGMVAEELFFGEAEEAGLGPDYAAINMCAEVVCQPDRQEAEEKTVDAPPGATYEECLRLAQEKVKTQPKWEEDYFKDWVKHRTRKLLRNRREVVDALAVKLIAKGQLSAQETRRVITSPLAARSARKVRNAPALRARDERRS